MLLKKLNSKALKESQLMFIIYLQFNNLINTLLNILIEYYNKKLMQLNKLNKILKSLFKKKINKNAIYKTLKLRLTKYKALNNLSQDK